MNDSVEKIIVVLGFSVTALGTLRCIRELKQNGYMIILAGTRGKLTIARYSNIPDQKIVFKDSLTGGLLELKEKLQVKPILLITQDNDAVEISENREILEPFYNFQLPTKEIFGILMEKSKFTHFAIDHHLSIPPTSFATNAAELVAAASGIGYPVIVKPYLLHAIRVNGEPEMQTLLTKLQDIHYHSLIVQEYIEGDDDNLIFCFLLFDREGRLCHRMMARKLRQWPVSYGTTSLAISESIPEIEKDLQDFISSVDLNGYCSIEFKYDRTRNMYFIMEPTIGRFNQQICLTKKAGVNFPRAMVSMLSGEDVGLIQQKDQQYWIYESNDFFSYLKSSKRFGYLRILLKPHTRVLFSFHDPLPAVMEIIEMSIKRIRKFASHV